MTTNTQTQTQQSGGDELDVFGREFLDCAGRFKEMMQGTETSFPDITGADMWGKLYYAGVLPNIIRFVILEGQAREREAERKGVIKTVRTHHEQYPNCPEPLQLQPQAGEGGEG